MLSDRERLAINLRVARTAKGITQVAAADAVEKTRGTIVNWENPGGTAEPSSAELSILAVLYGVSAKDLRFSELERRPAVPRDSTYEDVLARTRLVAEVANERPAVAADVSRTKKAASKRGGRRKKTGER